MKIAWSLLVIVGLFFSACSTHSFKLFDTNETKITTVSDEQYEKDTQFEWKITKGDRVEINIANLTAGEGDQQLNQMLRQGGKQQSLARDGTEGYLISNKGIVRIPLIGSISLLGLTENQAAEKIVGLMKEYLRNPFVQVKILNQKLFVLGEVRGPGVVQITHGTMSIFEALAYSGDLTDAAERTNVLVIRGGLRKPEVHEINLADMSKLKLTSLVLLPNDIVYVQPRGMKAYNTAFNEQIPFFDMLTSMMAPFILYDVFSNTKAVNVLYK